MAASCREASSELGHFVRMPNQNTQRLQATAADREAAAHYRELAAWLREIARKSTLPNPQQELLGLVRRYEMRAVHLDRE